MDDGALSDVGQALDIAFTPVEIMGF